jgi:hypothetical protein
MNTLLIILCLCSPPILDINPEALNTWLSGRYIEPESYFDFLLRMFDERDLEELIKRGGK